MKVIKYFIEFIVIISLFLIFKLLGRKMASDLGCMISNVVGSSFRSKKRVETNLQKAFPEINDIDKKNIFKKCGVTLEELLLNMYI